MVVVVLVGLWWTWVEVKDIAAIVVPAPPAVLDDLTAAPGAYLSAALHTMLTAFIALMIGTAFGLAAALAASRFRFVAGMSVPFMVLLSATPLFALFPLFARIIGYRRTCLIVACRSRRCASAVWTLMSLPAWRAATALRLTSTAATRRLLSSGAMRSPLRPAARPSSWPRTTGLQWDRPVVATSRPMAAIIVGQDLALILDVARFKYPPHWVSAERLLEAMRSIDPTTGRARGWLVLRRRNGSSALGLSVTAQLAGWQDLQAAWLQ